MVVDDSFDLFGIPVVDTDSSGEFDEEETTLEWRRDMLVSDSYTLSFDEDGGLVEVYDENNLVDLDLRDPETKVVLSKIHEELGKFLGKQPKEVFIPEGDSLKDK